MRTETVRYSYKPDKVNVLFVGESAPANGTFYYFGESTLTKYTAEAFSRAFKVTFINCNEFLRLFKKNNYYLDDLCLTPINHMTLNERKAARRNSVATLSERIKIYSPNSIISIMKAVEPYIVNAIRQAAIQDIHFYSLPFPAFSNHLDYVRELSSTLEDLIQRGIINRNFT